MANKKIQPVEPETTPKAATDADGKGTDRVSSRKAGRLSARKSSRTSHRTGH
jgi:hypothetical protein